MQRRPEKTKIAQYGQRIWGMMVQSAWGMMHRMRLALALLILPLLLWHCLPALAAGEATAKAAPSAAAAQAARSTGTVLTSNTVEGLEGAAVALSANLKPIFASAADLPAVLSLYIDRITDATQGAFGGWLARLAGSFLAGLLVALLLPRLLTHLRRHSPHHVESNIGSRMISAFLRDLVGLVALLIIFYAAHVTWFFDRSPRSELAV